MSTNPWGRPTQEELKRVLSTIEKSESEHDRVVERLELCVPAEITTSRGNVVPALTREISRLGVGLMHRGSICPGPVRLKLASETRDFEYQVEITWCHPCEGGMFLSGGQFLTKDEGE